MSESQSVDEGWEESLDSEQVTHVKGELPPGITLTGEWLVNVSEQVVVPMTTTDVVEALRSHRISEHSLVWRAGMQDWTALAEVPPLRLAAGALLLPSRPGPAPISRPSAARVSAAPVVQVTAHATERTLHPPPKAAARAARDERRRNTLPFGFPVVRDPATVREPKGLHPAPAPAPAPVARPSVASAAPAQAAAEDVDALAIYERATPSLTFSDSVRAEWQGTSHLLHQGPPSAPPPVLARPAPRARPEPKRAEPPAEPRPRLSLEPQSDPKPRLSLEPQSDPLQSRRPEPEHGAPSVQAPSSLAPTTSGLGHELPARGAGMWGDLSVVLASDLRAVQATSKRVTVIASIGSALLASLLTLWLAHSSTRKASEPAPAAQPAAVSAAPHVEPPAPPKAEVAPPVPAPSASATQASAPHPSPPALPRAAPKSAAPRVIARPKPVVTSDTEPAAAPSVPDSNPYADPAEVRPPKTPTAAFKEPPSPTSAPSHDSAPPKSTAPSGLEDNASPVRPAPTAAPGF